MVRGSLCMDNIVVAARMPWVFMQLWKDAFPADSIKLEYYSQFAKPTALSKAGVFQPHADADMETLEDPADHGH